MSNCKSLRWGFNLPTIGVISFLPVLFVSLWMRLAHAQTFAEIDKPTEAALLAEDWPKVAELLASVTPETPSPVERLIKGHACLALNRNNESLCLFLSVLDGDSLIALENIHQWQGWTNIFAERNPNNAIVYYFQGDALARLEQWNHAVKTFTKALEFKANHPLALNARGVVYCALRQFDNAMSDFLNAVTSNSRFADSHNNLGALAVQQKEGAQGALDDFNIALKISPDFVLALYGHGCVKLIIGQWQEGKNDLQNSISKNNCSRQRLLTKLEGTYQALTEKELETKLTAASGENPGFALESQLKKIGAGDWGFMGSTTKDLMKKYADDPTTLNSIVGSMQKAAKIDPKFSSYIPKYLDQARNDLAAKGTIKDLTQQFKSTSSIDGLGVGTKGLVKGHIGSEITETKTFSFDILQKQNQQKYNNLTDVRNNLLNDPAQGFKTDLSEGSWDEGNWPFTAEYGLLYEFDSDSVSPNSEPLIRR